MICEKHNLVIRAGNCSKCKRDDTRKLISELATESNKLAFEIHNLELENNKIDALVSRYEHDYYN